MPDACQTPVVCEPASRLVVGCMSGTSLDGLDVVLAEILGHGLSMKARLIGQISSPLGQELADSLRSLASGQPAPAIDYLKAARKLGELHAQTIESLLNAFLPPGRKVDFVVAHGQTIWHAPQEHLSWQLFDPWPIARRLNLPVISDLRQADLIAGGQGAPITPLADAILYGSDTMPRVITNLGGICNLTYLPILSADRIHSFVDGNGIDIKKKFDTEASNEIAGTRRGKTGGGIGGEIGGGDVGPCNLLLDGLARKVMGVPFDRDGRMAARGGISSIVYRLIRQSDFYQRPEPRTTGREDFSADWVDRIAQESGLKAYDLLASAVDGVARIIAEAIHQHDAIQARSGADDLSARASEPSAAAGSLGEDLGGNLGGSLGGGGTAKVLHTNECQESPLCKGGDKGTVLGGGEVILAGGGAKHHLLVRRIQHHLGDRWRVLLSDALGISLESREAMGMAVLGALSVDGVSITLPSITGSVSPGMAGSFVREQ